ncbi:hypothetical protein CBER1_09071 [Cercospora berteroae]|uniref:Uncharacterized protein n=1 Tax=Cercospora berteroae TaxID=357750 RepID=A0A2S6BWL2_9PEZI|nr:hypothetical protein CBER1_09071 [Cercospora berteroae]
MSAECGLDKLQNAAEAKSWDKESTSEDAHSELYSSLYCPSDVEAVREHLETPDAATGLSPLDSALNKWEAKAFGTRPKYEYPDSGYAFVLLGACAMTLGCKLSPATLQNMRKMLTKCGLMPDALTQMDAALNGPGSSKGEPWHLDSPGLLETANNLCGGGGMNVPAPHGMFKGPDDSRLVAKIEARMAAHALEKDDHESFVGLFQVQGEEVLLEGMPGQALEVSQAGVYQGILGASAAPA